MASQDKKFVAWRLCQWKDSKGLIRESKVGEVVYAEKAPNHNFVELEGKGDTLLASLQRMLTKEKVAWKPAMTVSQLGGLLANVIYVRREAERRARGDLNLKEYKKEFDRLDLPYSEDWSVEHFKAVYQKATAKK